jgi:hypothetical protein
MPLKVTNAVVGFVDMSRVPTVNALLVTSCVSVKIANAPNMANDPTAVTTTTVARILVSIRSAFLPLTGADAACEPDMALGYAQSL